MSGTIGGMPIDTINRQHLKDGYEWTNSKNISSKEGETVLARRRRQFKEGERGVESELSPTNFIANLSVPVCRKLRQELRTEDIVVESECVGGKWSQQIDCISKFNQLGRVILLI